MSYTTFNFGETIGISFLKIYMEQSCAISIGKI